MYSVYDGDLSAMYVGLYADDAPLAWLVACNEDVSVYLAPEGAARVLDFACGIGSYVKRHLDLGATIVVGVDVSPHQISACRLREPRGEFLTADVRSFSSENFKCHHGKYDLVNASFLYDAAKSHDDLRCMIQSVAKCLRVGGVHTALCINPGIRRSADEEWTDYGVALLDGWAPDRCPEDGEEVGGRFALGRQDLDTARGGGTTLRGRCFHLSTYGELLVAAGFGEIEFLHPVSWPLKEFCRSREYQEMFSRYAQSNPEMIAIRARRKF